MKFVSLAAELGFREAIAAIPLPLKLVVCGSLEDREYIEEGLAETERSIAETVALSLQLNLDQWLDEQRSNLELESKEHMAQIVGAWPTESIVKTGFSLAHDMMSGELHTQLIGAHVDAGESWQIPAHFHFGGWNECPAPEVHCAIWKYWQEKYGAHIVAISNDVIEAYVERPPTSEAEAMILAWQQYLYCGDIVDQGVETIASLAATIKDHQVWFFWWD